MAYRAHIKIVLKDGTIKEYWDVYIKQSDSGFRISKQENFSNEEFIPMSSINTSACRRENPSEGCFISTAVYQFHDNPEINLRYLRDFRDNTMRSKPLTNKMVELYYRISPPVAEHLCENKKQSDFIKTCFIDSSVKLIQKMDTAKKLDNKYISWIYELLIYITYSFGLFTSWVLSKIHW